MTATSLSIFICSHNTLLQKYTLSNKFLAIAASASLFYTMIQTITKCLLALFSIMTTYHSSNVVTAAEETHFDCTIHRIGSMSARGEPTISDQIVCKMEDNESYISFYGNIDEFVFKSSFPLELGRTQLSIPTLLLIDGDHLDLDDHRASDSIVLSRRHLSQRADYRVGIWNVLAVRIIDSTGDAPTKSKEQLGTDIFDDSFNLVS